MAQGHAPVFNEKKETRKMKKLMIVAAVALAAVVSQAAQLDWAQTSLNAFSWQDGKTGGGHTAYLLQFSSATAADTLYAKLKDGSVTFADALSDYKVAETTTKTGTFNATKVDQKANKSPLLSEGDPMQYAMLLTTTTASGDEYFLLSSTVNGIAYDPNGEIEKEGTPASFASAQFSATAESRTGWTKVESVPEPTSGLLLLLGVAGLALRRRRA